MLYLNKSFTWMIIFLGCVSTVCIMILPSLVSAFSHNYTLNSIILLALLVGIGASFRGIYCLWKEHLAFKSYGRHGQKIPSHGPILSPLWSCLESPGVPVISPLNVRVLLSSIESRMDEIRELTRYVMGLLIFLGLLGTFWGLSQTIGSIASVIGGIDIGANDIQDGMENLKMGLKSPLSGMGTAFSCSLFGVTGSLVVGFLDLQVGRFSTHFLNDLEEYLWSYTHASSEARLGNGTAFSVGLLEQTIEAMTHLQTHVRRSEENRLTLLKTLQLLSEKMIEVSDHMKGQHQLAKTMTEQHSELKDILGDLGRLRGVESTLNKILEESVEGRSRSVQEVRNEIRIIARTLSALASGQDIAA